MEELGRDCVSGSGEAEEGGENFPKESVIVVIIDVNGGCVRT